MARKDLADDLESNTKLLEKRSRIYFAFLERISKAGFKPGIFKMNENP